MKAFIVSILAILLLGCGHAVRRGSVAMKIDERTAHVCMGEGEVKEGDKVTLYYNQCPLRGNRCTKKVKGEGVVTEVLNEHYSVVQFAPGAEFVEGSFVEKK
jgi:hypothetical protein